MEEDRFEYEGLLISYQIVRSKRKTMAIQVKGDGTVIARVPSRLSSGRVRAFVLGHGGWISRHVAEQNRRQEVKRQILWTDGTVIPVQGIQRKLAVVHCRGKTSVRVVEDTLVVETQDDDPEVVKTVVYQWFRLEAQRELADRTAYWAKIMGADYKNITIRGQKSRWGSCSGAGNLNFNWKLMMVPPRLLDYVVVHELAHRFEMNHSRNFWVIVERIMPDYQGLRRRLKEYEDQIISEF